ncbi:MAG: hypothetical protein GDA43_21705 [Hormoscilla sp. SP5CHS1]|nr:hypothetical protein [Hormoscilla sp. SP5CHS1]
MNKKIALAVATIACLGVSTSAGALENQSPDSYLASAQTGVELASVSIVNDGRSYQHEVGQGIYRVRYNYTGRNWTHADVAPIRIDTDKPIAILPVQYTTNKLQAGATVDGAHIGKRWNTITTQEMKQRLEALGFYVLTPTIQMYGENIAGFQALEHFIAGVHKGNRNVQTVILTADAHIASAANPRPGPQMLVTGLHRRDIEWENRIQFHIDPFYLQQGLTNIGARVRGGKSDREGSPLAWHPLIERAAEYGPQITIIEVAKARDIADRAGSVAAGRQWAAPVFDGVATAMAEHACARGAFLESCLDQGAIARQEESEPDGAIAVVSPSLPSAKKIEFRAGGQAALEWGKLASLEESHYVLNAAAGQLMSINVSSPPDHPVVLRIKTASGNRIFEADESAWSDTLPSSEDYYITVVNKSETAQGYTISVLVE